MSLNSKLSPKGIVVFLGLIMVVFMLCSLVFGQLSSFSSMHGANSVSALPFVTISYNGSQYDSIASFTAANSSFEKGSVVRLCGVLPEKDSYNSHALCISTYYCGVKVFCGDELIYSYGDPQEQKAVGSGYHFIPLPEDYYEKETLVELTVTDANSLFETQSFLFGEWSAIHLFHIRQNSITVCIDIFMFILGCVLVAVSLVGLLFSRQFLVIFSVGILSLTGGLWTMCNSKFIQLFTNDLDLILQLEYQSFYLLVFAMLAYIYIIVRKSRPLRLACGGIFVLSFGVVFAIELLQYLDIKDFSETLSTFHLLAGIDFAAFIAITVCKIKFGRKAGSELFFLMAVIGLTLFITVDYAVFYYNRTNSLSASPIVSIPFGMMFFVVTMLLSGVNYLFNAANERNERLLLRQLAYTDALTSLSNRAKCEEVVSSLIDSRSEFTFVLFDLNNLKRINDTMGHKVGDALLIGFGEIITASFPLSPAVCRIGGDEFGVILPFTDSEKLNSAMYKYESVSEEKSSSGELNFSAAYGFSTSTEVHGGSWEDMYKLADSRMYEMKSEMHKAEAHILAQ